MPCATVSDLLPTVRRLPPHAQEIFLSAFNAWPTYAGRNLREQEETAFRVAWAAVKTQCHKRGDTSVATR